MPVCSKHLCCLWILLVCFPSSADEDSFCQKNEGERVAGLENMKASVYEQLLLTGESPFWVAELNAFDLGGDDALLNDVFVFYSTEDGNPPLGISQICIAEYLDSCEVRYSQCKAFFDVRQPLCDTLFKIC